MSENHWKDTFQFENHRVSRCLVVWDTLFFKCCDWHLVVKKDGLEVQKTCRGRARELSSWISSEMLANFNFCVKFSGHSYFFLKSWPWFQTPDCKLPRVHCCSFSMGNTDILCHLGTQEMLKYKWFLNYLHINCSYCLLNNY